MISKPNRDRLLKLARLFDRCAMQLRIIVKNNTPKRKRELLAKVNEKLK